MTRFLAPSLIFIFACSGDEGEDTSDLISTTSNLPAETGNGPEDTGDETTWEGSDDRPTPTGAPDDMGDEEDTEDSGENPSGADEDSGDDETGKDDSGDSGEEPDPPPPHSCENEIDDDTDNWEDCADPGCLAFPACAQSPVGEFFNLQVGSYASRFKNAYHFLDDGTCATQNASEDPDNEEEFEDCSYEQSGKGTPENPWHLELFDQESEPLDAFDAYRRGDALFVRHSPQETWALLGSLTTIEEPPSDHPNEFLKLGAIEFESDWTHWHTPDGYAAWQIQADEGETIRVAAYQAVYEVAKNTTIKLFGPLDAPKDEQKVHASSSASAVPSVDFAITKSGPYRLLVASAEIEAYRLRLRKLDSEDQSLQYHLESKLLAALTGRPDAIHAADFNGDEKLDLAVVTGISAGTGAQSGKLLIFLQNDSGGMAAPLAFDYLEDPPTFLLANSMVSADFNKDENIDLAIGHEEGVSVLFGTGDGNFGAPESLQLEAAEGGSESSESGAEEERQLEDVQVALLDATPGKSVLAVATPGMLYRFVGAENGTFSEDNSIEIKSERKFTLASGDVDGDGTQDVVLSSGSENQAAFFIVSGGDWTQQETKLEGSKNAIRAHAIAIADLDGNDEAEIIVGHSDDTTLDGRTKRASRLQVYERQESGRYRLLEESLGLSFFDNAGGMTGDIQVANLDGRDGLEIVSIRDRGGQRRNGDAITLLTQREGGWIPQYFPVVESGDRKIRSLVTGDFNGDGCSDVVSIVANSEGRIDLHSGQGCNLPEDE